MLNQRPVFLVGFAYGGSNLLLNLLRSHPGLCSPRGELNEVFKGKPGERAGVWLAKRLRYLPCVLAERRDVFGFNDWRPRNPFTPFTQRRVDRILFDEKLEARAESQNHLKSEDQFYTEDEIRAARLLVKNLDGLIMLTPELSRMYPDATFLALVRNGYAVCEGHLRRGHALETIAKNYETGCRAMLEHSQSIPGFHILRYEDMVADPGGTLRQIYGLAGLDAGLVTKVRLQVKPVISKEGRHHAVRQGKPKQMFWYGLDEFHRHFRSDANKNQIDRLSPEQKKLIREHCGASLERFGYLL